MADEGWEVSLVLDTASRQPIARDVADADLPEAIARAFAIIEAGTYRHPAWKTAAVLTQRMGATAEAQRAKWEASFYDIDRAGRRRRRYKKPKIEAEWEAWVKAEAKAEREARKQSNAGRRAATDGS